MVHCWAPLCTQPQDGSDGKEISLLRDNIRHYLVSEHCDPQIETCGAVFPRRIV
jgi:hypothetical protein